MTPLILTLATIGALCVLSMAAVVAWCVAAEVSERRARRWRHAVPQLEEWTLDNPNRGRVG